MHKSISMDWDKIKSWSDQLYMPYSAQPVGKGLLRDSAMHSVSVADMIVTRFKYGINANFEWALSISWRHWLLPSK